MLITDYNMLCLEGIPVPDNYSNHLNGGDVENPTNNSQAVMQMRNKKLHGENYFKLWFVLNFLLLHC